jgi:hypothetical protein
MYRYKLRGFWNVFVDILVSLMVSVRSRNVVDAVRGSTFHLSALNLFSWF